MTTRAADIAQQVGHPIIDADGHILEFTPAALPYLREAMGPEVFERYRARMSPLRSAMVSPTLEERRMSRVPQAGWWGSPARHAIDLATSMAPRLLHERLGDLGFSYAILYPTSGMGSAGVQDDEVRVGLCRGFNDFFASVYGPFQDRVTVAGIIPMNTVEEAVAELEHCKAIGLKVVSIANGVLRPIKAPQPGYAKPNVSLKSRSGRGAGRARISSCTTRAMQLPPTCSSSSWLHSTMGIATWPVNSATSPPKRSSSSCTRKRNSLTSRKHRLGRERSMMASFVSRFEASPS